MVTTLVYELGEGAPEDALKPAGSLAQLATGQPCIIGPQNALYISRKLNSAAQRRSMLSSSSFTRHLRRAAAETSFSAE